MTAAFCPHCGYDLVRDTPVLINDFSMWNSSSPLYWRDKMIKLTDSERIICYTLMRAYPGAAKVDTLLDRIGSDAETNIIEVFVCRARRKIRTAGGPNPIGTIYPRKYVWLACGGGNAEVAEETA